MSLPCIDKITMYFSALCCYLGLFLVRRFYKHSQDFYQILERNGWFKLDKSATKQQKVEMMKAIFSRHTPLVSYLIADTTQPHAIIFRGFALIAGICVSAINFDNFYHGFDEIPKYLSIFNCFQKLFLLYGIVGLIFSRYYGDLQTVKIYQEQLKNIKEFKKGGGDMQKAPEDLMTPLFYRTALDFVFLMHLHSSAFVLMLLLFSTCQMISIFIEIASMCFSVGLKANINTFMWFIVQGFRTMSYVLVMKLAVSFTAHKKLSDIGVKSSVAKTFWQEYAMVISFAQFNTMLPFAAAFDFTKSFEFGFESIFIIIFTVYHLYLFIPSLIREWELLARDTEYTNDEYVKFFDSWKDEHEANKKMIIGYSMKEVDEADEMLKKEKSEHGSNNPDLQLISSYADAGILGILSQTLSMALPVSASEWEEPKDLDVLPPVEATKKLD